MAPGLVLRRAGAQPSACTVGRSCIGTEGSGRLCATQCTAHARSPAGLQHVRRTRWQKTRDAASSVFLLNTNGSRGSKISVADARTTKQVVFCRLEVGTETRPRRRDHDAHRDAIRRATREHRVIRLKHKAREAPLVRSNDKKTLRRLSCTALRELCTRTPASCKLQAASWIRPSNVISVG
jgi:hypothetical protein